MQLERIVSAGDSRIVLYRGVGDPELLHGHGLFVAEGRLVVRRAIEDGRYRVGSVLVNDAAAAQLADVLAWLPADTPVYVCEPALFRDLTGYNIHRGCLALVERPTARLVGEVVAGAHTIVVLEAVANADNVGAAFRNAAAFGADAIVLSAGCCDPLYRKAVRTSMGAVLRVPFAIADEWPRALTAIRGAGFEIVALTPREPSLPLADFAARGRPRKLALVAGAEGSGLSPDVEALATVRVRIPIAGDVDSLNVATAVAIALYGLRSD